MTFSIVQIVLLVVGILVAGAIVGRLTKKRDGESFLSRVFTNNKELDTTIGLIGVNMILIFMLVSYHDDLANDTTAIVAAFMAMINLYQSIVLGKAVANAASNGNGSKD